MIGVGLVLGGAGAAVVVTSAPDEVTAEAGSVLDPPEAATTTTVPSTAATTPTTTAPAPEGFVPDRLVIDPIGLDAPLVATTVDPDGAFVPPSDLDQLGWWRGVRPGAGHGSVLVAGHLDARRYGRGPLAAIVDLRPGDVASVAGPDDVGRTYVLRGIQTFPKDELPAAELFGVDGPERLVLVTCGGTFDRGEGHWDSNVVAVLDPVP